MEKYNASHQGKCEILCLDKNNPVHQYCQSNDWLGSRIAEMQLYYGESQAECTFTLPYWCEKPNTLLRWVNKSNAGKQKEFFLFTWCWQILTWKAVSSFGYSTSRKMGSTWRFTRKITGLENMCYQEILKQLRGGAREKSAEMLKYKSSDIRQVALRKEVNLCSFFSPCLLLFLFNLSKKSE